MDNPPSHKIINKFSNIQKQFAVSHTTSLIQPLEQGIIRAF